MNVAPVSAGAPRSPTSPRPTSRYAIPARRCAGLTRAPALTARETGAAETPARRAMSRIVKDDFAGPDRARMVDPKSTDPAPGHQAEGSGQVLARPAPEARDLEDEADLELDVARRPHGGDGAESARVHELAA